MRLRSLLAAALLALACASSPGEVPVSIAGNQVDVPSDCQRTAYVVRDWRNRLDLRDWQITLHCAADPDFGDDVYGSIDPFFEERQADLWINPTTPDKVLVVIHELLHLKFGLVCNAQAEIVEEQQLRTVARLLRELDGRKLGTGGLP